MAISEMVASAFMAALAQEPALHKRWIALSFRIGGLLPRSTLMMSVQRCGELDILVRCMEREFRVDGAAAKNIYASNYHIVLSAQWVGAAYEIVRLLAARHLFSTPADGFDQLHKDLELIRVPLEKHELARDQKTKASLFMQHQEDGIPSGDAYHYRYDDPRRSHIMPAGLSDRGSLTWHVLDLVANEARWVERLSLSERFLSIGEDLTKR